MKISVLQWNVLFEEKAKNVISLIKQIDADIVCLQELTQTSAINLHRDLPVEISALGYDYYYEPTTDTPDFIIGNGIFSKFPIINSKAIYVSEEDLSNKDYPQFSRAYIESILNVSGSKLTVGVVHLSYSPHFFFFPAKEAEAQKFIEIISPNNERYILTGDFNAVPSSNLINNLDQILTPAGPNYSENTWTTKPFESHGFSAETLDWRLDYVFTSKDLQVVSSKIIKTDYSDHLPILAEINF